jgi:glycerophosphoryl diester phosphodiesterase
MIALPNAFLTTPLAHRGYHDFDTGCPENSIAAFVAAIDSGYGIELDVQISSDGQAMVFHDYDLDRMTAEVGAVKFRTAADLGRVKLNNSDETIPTLARVLQAVAGRTPILVEIKDPNGSLGSSFGALEQAVAKVVVDYEGPVAVMSFNSNSVAALAEYAPDVPRGLATGPFKPQNWRLVPSAVRRYLRKIPNFKWTGASFISHRAADLRRPLLQKIRASGTPVLCWTINSQADEDIARQFADNITFESYPANIPAA